MKTTYQNQEAIKYNIDIHNPIHFLKRTLMRRYLKTVRNVRKVADVGCGSGVMSRYVNAQFHGYDLHEELIEIAKRMNPHQKNSFFVKNLYDIEENDYDVVICTEMLEYLEDDEKGLRKMGEMLRPGGKLLMTVPVNKAFETSIDKSEGFRRYEKRVLVEKLEKSGFVVEKARYWGFPLTNLFYMRVYVPSSEKRKETGTFSSKAKIILQILKIAKYVFLFDLLFNVKHSFDLAIMARKK